jgi:hypothetical protein
MFPIGVYYFKILTLRKGARVPSCCTYFCELHALPPPPHCPYYLLWISLQGDKNEKIVLQFLKQFIDVKNKQKI